jgi:2,4-dienoyl-CoA reductase-like NADH-dependent reductase (Old Yellow Enzyme family)
MQIHNRFVRSGTYEGLAKENGEVTDKMIKMYNTLARGDIGLIITGISYIHTNGKCGAHQTGIHSDEMIPGLKKLANAIHQEGGKIAIQIAHGGLQSSKKLVPEKPIAPSSRIRNPITLIKPKKMNENEIKESIKAYSEATRRGIEANADAVQIHAAHGYLINQFLSPFFNLRSDKWGGSDEKRFQFLKEIILEVKKVLTKEKALLVKFNSNDFTKKEGITPPLAAKYAEWLRKLGIDGLELSCGTGHFSMFNVMRGEVPVNEISRALPRWQRPFAKMMMKKLVGKYDFTNEYNLEAAMAIKSSLGDIPLILVGGIRRFSSMEQIIKHNHADCVSMCRPFIREPHLVKKFKEGKKSSAACISCNKCAAALMNDLTFGCYVNGVPKKKK